MGDGEDTEILLAEGAIHCAKPNNNDFIKPHHKLFMNRKLLTRKCRVIDVTHCFSIVLNGIFLTPYIFHLKDISFGSVAPVSIVATES